MSKRDRKRQKARRKSFADPKPIILVITEGARTEKQYLEGFAASEHNSLVKVEVVGGAGVPRTIVQEAKRRKLEAQKRARSEKDDNLLFDQVWCVFDVDDHPRLEDAKQMALDNQIETAISNPCIELWLWLHFSEQPGMQHRHDLQGNLRQYVPAYGKHVNFADYKSGYCDAVRRARRLDEHAIRDNEEGRNPTTGVWRLTEQIRKHSGRS
jgi:hypothetical protein